MAILEDIIGFALQHSALVLFASLLLYCAFNVLRPGLSSIPGPFFAKFTNIWRFIDVYKGDAQFTHIELHRKHGDYVRLGPNLVSVNNIEDMKLIYGISKGYRKTRFYAVQQPLAKGRAMKTLFTTLDDDFHARIRRPISSFYSMSGIVTYEPFVDATIDLMVRKMETFADSGKAFDMGIWLQYYAFDVIGKMTFGEELGFLEGGHDVDGIMYMIERMFDYAGTIGQMPWLDQLLLKNPVRRILGILGRGGTNPVARFARKHVEEGLRKRHQVSKEKKNKTFLERFLDAQKSNPEVVSDTQVLSYTTTNMNAGSDTTAISLRAVIYFTLKHPSVLKRLLKELDEAAEAGKLSNPITWKESQDLPYFDAVVKEALRLHPAVGLLLERIVPNNGLRLSKGPFLPGGTVVGVNPWVIHHHPVFGEDVDTFIPERWLCGKEESEADFSVRKEKMVSATLTFGAGQRTCIGKNISLLEIYKLIPTLFRSFELSFVDPETDWKLINAWFVRQEGMIMKIRRRG